MSDADAMDLKKTEETFEMNGEYIAGQAREAMRVFFLPVSSIARAARSKKRELRRDALRQKRKSTS